MSTQARATPVATVSTAAITNPILGSKPLGFPWPTIDPFLFCVYHDDLYPKGKADMTPDASLAGRNMGQDFEGIDGWRMYHGMTVPGFPSHPHRGFETVTIVRKGLIDHSDSLGATARFGKGATADNGADNGAEIGVVSADPAADVCGDVQWLTAGKGIVHSEMFPLLNEAGNNPLELFQIWLNLPASHKMVAPHFTMFWDEKIPRRVDTDAHGKTTAFACIAGRFAEGHGDAPLTPLAPPPDSWAAQPGSDVAIWTLKMQPGARWTLPRATGADSRRMLYFFKGASVSIGVQTVNQHAAIELNAGLDVELVNGSAEAEFLVLQGKPINEPVAQYGPFVMNTQGEIHQAFADYRRTEFGGWPFPDTAPVHGRETKRFAKHADGKVEAVA
jgi:quercetin 2,3-dioxygenase